MRKLATRVARGGYGVAYVSPIRLRDGDPESESTSEEGCSRFLHTPLKLPPTTFGRRSSTSTSDFVTIGLSPRPKGRFLRLMLKGGAVPGNASDAAREPSQSEGSPGRVRTRSGHIRIVAPSKVLVVDDEELLVDGYARLLGRAGFQVNKAYDGQTALDRIEVDPPDVVISDIAMPGVDGLRFLKKVRAMDVDVSVILVTGVPEISSAMQAVEYGACRYLPKPVEDEILLDAVRSAASQARVARMRREVLESTSFNLQSGDLATLDTRFTSALNEMWMAFQPIVRSPGDVVFGYEALMRSREKSLPHPGALLDAARRLQRSHELGRRVRELVAQAAPQAPADAKLFVNVNVTDLDDDELTSKSGVLAPLGERIVLELTERESLQGVSQLSDKIRKLRDLGFGLAVDDLGAGYAGLTSFALLEPDVAKIDMSLVRDIHLSDRKRRVVRSMARLCEEELGVLVVCEGVENADECKVLVEDSVQLMQGYYFGKPEAGFRKP